MNEQQINEEQYLRQIMANSKPHICSCGGHFFKQVVTMRIVSSVMSGTGKEVIVPIPMFRCDDCGMPVEQLKIPEANANQKEEARKVTSSLITE